MKIRNSGITLVCFFAITACRDNLIIFHNLPSAPYSLEEIPGSLEWRNQWTHDFDFTNGVISNISIYKNKQSYVMVAKQPKAQKIIAYSANKVYLIPENKVKIEERVLIFCGITFQIEQRRVSYQSIHGDRGNLGEKLFPTLNIN